MQPHNSGYDYPISKRFAGSDRAAETLSNRPKSHSERKPGHKKFVPEIQKIRFWNLKN